MTASSTVTDNVLPLILGTTESIVKVGGVTVRSFLWKLLKSGPVILPSLIANQAMQVPTETDDGALKYLVKKE